MEDDPPAFIRRTLCHALSKNFSANKTVREIRKNHPAAGWCFGIFCLSPIVGSHPPFRENHLTMSKGHKKLPGRGLLLPFAELTSMFNVHIFGVTQSRANVGGPSFSPVCYRIRWHFCSICGEMHGFHMARVYRNTLRTGPWEGDEGWRSYNGTRSFAPRTLAGSETRSPAFYIQSLPQEVFTSKWFSASKAPVLFQCAYCLGKQNTNLQTNFHLISGDFIAACFASLFHFPSTAQKPNHFCWVDFSNFKIQNCHTCSKPPSDCRVATCYAHSVFTWFPLWLSKRKGFLLTGTAKSRIS